MDLTSAQEMELLRKYQPYLVRLAVGYCNSISLPYSDCLDDLLQEARIALLQHIRHMKDESEIFLCKIHILHAMALFKESTHVLRMAHNAYQELNGAYCRVSVEERDGLTDNDDTDATILFQEFWGTLSEEEQSVVRLRASGYSTREIVPLLSLSQPTVSRRLRDIRDKFRRCFSAEEKGVQMNG